eukprot:scaffold12517_cov45-Phaeocystis_antarctica.AAC.2
MRANSLAARRHWRRLRGGGVLGRCTGKEGGGRAEDGKAVAGKAAGRKAGGVAWTMRHEAESGSACSAAEESRAASARPSGGAATVGGRRAARRRAKSRDAHVHRRVADVVAVGNRDALGPAVPSLRQGRLLGHALLQQEVLGLMHPPKVTHAAARVGSSGTSTTTAATHRRTEQRVCVLPSAQAQQGTHARRALKTRLYEGQVVAVLGLPRRGGRARGGRIRGGPIRRCRLCLRRRLSVERHVTGRFPGPAAARGRRGGGERRWGERLPGVTSRNRRGSQPFMLATARRRCGRLLRRRLCGNLGGNLGGRGDLGGNLRGDLGGENALGAAARRRRRRGGRPCVLRRDGQRPHVVLGERVEDDGEALPLPVAVPALGHRGGEVVRVRRLRRAA